MAQAEPPMATIEEKAAGAVRGTLEKLSKNKFSLIKKKLKDWEAPAGSQRIPERCLRCAHRTELAHLIIHHYGALCGLQFVQRLLDDIGEQEGSRELREYLEQEGTSFRSWWKWKSRFPHLSPHDLSQAGFYYVGPGDRVRCFSCGGELDNWQPGDVPLTRHQRSYPDCPYVRGKMGIDAGIVGPMQKLSLKDQPVCPEMAEEWNRLATYRSGPWYPGEEPVSAQSGIKINPPPGIRGTSVYEKQVPFPGGSFHPGTFPGQILPVPVMFTLQPGPTGGDVLFPGPFLPTLQSGPKVGGVDPQVLQMKGSSTAAGVGPSVYEPQGSIKGGDVQHQGLFPAGNIFYPVPFVTTLLPDPTVTEILFPVTLQPGPTVGGVDPQAQNMKRSSADQEKASSAAMEGGASGVQEVSSIYWLRESTMECELCEKIPPIIHFTTSMLGRTYRAHLPWKGLFRCIETGIQFFVNTPALIDFELVSWGNYLKSLQEKSIETVGPLFNIRVLSGQVSAVYLPHYVCLKGRDVDVKKFKIVHYNAKGMTLESPSKIEPFYVTLENPTFSLIGVVYKVASLFRTKIPAHGAVFIYGRFIKGYTIHLYFMPQDPLVKQAVHKKETDNGFFWLDKPPRTKTVYTRKKYVIQGPESAKIDPEDLKLRFDAEPEMYNYSEIYLPSVDEDILLEVTSERDEKSVWHALLRKEELMPGQPMAGGQHFVDKHRTELIERISNIDPVLDDLLGAQILTQEQYDKVRSNSTCQERMRQLYDCVRAWGSNQKDVFFRSIEQHNPHLIRDLKSK